MSLPSANRLLRDIDLRHRIGLMRVSAGEAQAMTSLIEDVLADLDSRVRRAARSPAALKRLRFTFNEYRSRIRTVGSERLRDFAKELAAYEAAFQVESLQAVLPPQVDITRPAMSLIRSAASTEVQEQSINKWMSKLADKTAKRAYNEISVGIVEGESIPEIMRRVDDTVNMTRPQVEALVRTTTNEVSTAAKLQVYEENDDVIGEEMYVATLDTRTSAVCRALDGKRFPIGKGPRPPQHFNCRSTVVPVVKSWKELGLPFKESESTRASIDGQVPASVNYEEWLRDQPNAVQNRVLGSRRADMFREGDVTLERFVADGRPLTLKELQRLEKSDG